MHLKEIDLSQVCYDLPEVTNQKVYESGKLSAGGLFSQQIFGPTKSYYCACSKENYHGKSSGLKTCEKCNVDITSTEERRRRFAKITLPFPIMNPLYFYILTQSKPSLRKVFLNVLTYKNRYYFDEDGKLNKLSVNDESPEGVDILEGLDGALKIVDSLILASPDDPSIKYIAENIEKLKVFYVLIIPPEFRPNHRDQNGVNISDEINQYYTLLLVRCNYIKSNPLSIGASEELYRNSFKFIQSHVIKLYDFVLNKLSKKQGLLRSNILGKRVDFSGRAVISPDPTLNLDECRVPYVMILEILKPQFVSYLVERRVCKWYNHANKLVEECIKKEDNQLFDYVQDFCKNKVCVLNRQPTLHRLSVMGFKVLPHVGKTIQIHPMVCHAYNGDFDGDSIDGSIKIRMSDKVVTINMSQMVDQISMEFKSEKTRDDGVHIKKYTPMEKLEIMSIDPDSGKTKWKNISEYSVHDNLEMYKIQDTQARFETFWSSSDHSLIVFDEDDNQIKKITPTELLDNPQGKYLIQEGVDMGGHKEILT